MTLRLACRQRDVSWDDTLSFYLVAAQVASHLDVASHVCEGGCEGAKMMPALVLRLFRAPPFWGELGEMVRA